jgi:hypothetical protein
MIKNYKLSYSNSEPTELLLLKTEGQYNTWRVYFDSQATTDDKGETTYTSKYIELVKQKDEDVTALSLFKEVLVNELTSYDSSTDVNSFIINGNSFWLDKSTRVGLMNSTNIFKSAGYENTVLWLGSTPLTIKCDLVINLLAGLEIYALNCFNKTAEHKKNIEALQSISDAIKFDYTTGYPDKLVINL